MGEYLFFWGQYKYLKNCVDGGLTNYFQRDNAQIEYISIYQLETIKKLKKIKDCFKFRNSIGEYLFFFGRYKYLKKCVEVCLTNFQRDNAQIEYISIY